MPCVYLVWAPIDEQYADARTHFSPSLGLVSLKSYLAHHRPDVSVRYVDGIVNDVGEICDEIRSNKPDFVGISTQLISYGHTLEIAEAAKDVGAKSVVGGAQATQLAREIIARRHEIIDFVVSGDGEEALERLVTGVPADEISNISYFDHQAGKVRSNPIRSVDLDSLPFAKYDGIDLKYYDERLASETLGSGMQRYMRVYSHKGCGYRAFSGICVFCGRADEGVRYVKPRRFLEEISMLAREYGADYVFDVGDDILFDLEWVRETVALKRQRFAGLDVGLSVFARSDRINRSSAELLAELGVTNVTVGFESGDERVLRKTGKGRVSPEDNLRAASRLMEQGIDITPSYVLGLPGETEESLRNTLANAERVVEMAEQLLGRRPAEMVANLLEPSPGSVAFRAIRRSYPDRYEGRDQFELLELQRDYFRRFFAMDDDDQYSEFRRLLVDYGQRINRLTGFADPQGWLVDET